MYERIIGTSVGFRKINYNWRDMALYALAVGADENDLLYTYEKGMKAIPSFGVLPYFSVVNVEPQTPVSAAGCYLARELMIKELGREFPIGLHMGHEIIMYRPFDPIKGTMVFNDTITKMYDRGPKGVIVETEMPVYDEAGNLICLNRSTSMMPDGGGYGGEPPRKPAVEYPDREPDYVLDSYFSKTQNVLYRLTGDTHPAHVDPEVAKKITPRGPFMQGLCPFGYACRMLINAIIPGEPERMTRMAVQMRAVSYPGTPIQVRAWKVGEKKVSFKMFDMESGNTILNNCEFEWK